VERASSSSDAFGLLGLPAQFDLDPNTIEQAFHERSKELHPDRFASAPAAERVAVLSKSRALNDAYKTLKSPVGRAEYLLARAGVSIGDNERLDPTFLMEILELREELAEARVAKRTSEVETLCGKMKARRKKSVDALTPLFEANDLAAIKEQLILLRYINRYLEECDSALDED
jgi:molecular chaperone HscB